MQPLIPANSATVQTIATCGDNNRLFMKLPIRGFIARSLANKALQRNVSTGV
jgi:sulfite reductase beta subunit-like hemoprotein